MRKLLLNLCDPFGCRYEGRKCYFQSKFRFRRPLEATGQICHNYLTPVSNAVWFDLTNVKQTLPSSIEHMEDINIRPLSIMDVQ